MNLVNFWCKQEKFIQRQEKDGVEFQSFGLEIDMKAREVRIMWDSSVSLYREPFESLNVKIKKNFERNLSTKFRGAKSGAITREFNTREFNPLWP